MSLSIQLCLQQLFSTDPLMSTLLSSSCPYGQGLMTNMMIEDFGGSYGILPPALVYTIASLVPANISTYSNYDQLEQIIDEHAEGLARLVVEGFSIFQKFVISEEQVAGTQVPVAAFGQAEDGVMESTMTYNYYSALPSSPFKNYKFYETDSGAASHCEAGAWDIVFPEYVEFIESL